MDETTIDGWCDRYIEVFSACGRGERSVEDVLPFYSTPLLLTNDDDARMHLLTSADVEGVLRTHIGGMIEAKYDHSVTLERSIQVVSRTTALLRGSYSRRRSDDSEIAAFSVTYVITRGNDDHLEISVLAMEAPPVIV